MKKWGRWVFPLLTILCCLGFAAYLFLSRRAADHTAPTISFASEELEVSVEATEAELLAGVTAYDEQDGDVSASIVVEGISNISKDQTATATYAAFDQAGNVSKAQRVLRYTDYHSPRFSLSAPLVFRSGVSFDVFRYLGVEDVVDGTLDNQIKATLVSGETAITAEGIHEVEFRVTNSMGDTAYLTVPVEVYSAGTYNATVGLSDYLVYVHKGAQFDSNSYLRTLQIGTREISLINRPEEVTVQIDSDVNTMKAGTYSVTYTVQSGTYTGYTRLIVVVEE